MEQTPQQAAQTPTQEQLAFKLSYDFHRAAQGMLVSDMKIGFASTAAAIGIVLFAPQFLLYAIGGITAMTAWDVYKGRQRNLMLRNVFEASTKDMKDDVKALLRPIEEALAGVRPFSKEDGQKFINQLTGSPLKIGISIAIILMTPPILAPLGLAIFGAMGVAGEDKLALHKTMQGALQAGEHMKTRNPALEMPA